jgi:DnaJ-class molecular chaperone
MSKVHSLKKRLKNLCHQCHGSGEYKWHQFSNPCTACGGSGKESDYAARVLAGTLEPEYQSWRPANPDWQR